MYTWGRRESSGGSFKSEYTDTHVLKLGRFFLRYRIVHRRLRPGIVRFGCVCAKRVGSFGEKTSRSVTEALHNRNQAPLSRCGSGCVGLFGALIVTVHGLMCYTFLPHKEKISPLDANSHLCWVCEYLKQGVLVLNTEKQDRWNRATLSEGFNNLHPQQCWGKLKWNCAIVSPSAVSTLKKVSNFVAWFILIKCAIALHQPPTKLCLEGVEV